MRRSLVYAGIAALIGGLIVYAIALVGVAQATANFVSCLNGFPSYPMYGVPATCSAAMGQLALYQGLEALAAVLGVIGIAVLVVGLVLGPEGPAPAPMPFYPPPVYAPPPGYTHPQTPPSPPPPP